MDKKWSEIEWLGDNLYEVLQGLLDGAYMTKMMQNLDHIQPYAARGCEAWFKIVRQNKGNTGPRLMRLVKEVFAPVRTKNLEQLSAAVESWEGHVQDFEITGQRLGPILKTFGLMELVPDAMEEDLIKMR